MASLYQVVFSGHLKPGVSPDRAAADLTSLFKLPAQEAEALIRAGEPAVIKRDVDEINIDHYQSLFDEIGLIVSIESMTNAGAQETSNASSVVSNSLEQDAASSERRPPQPHAGANPESSASKGDDDALTGDRSSEAKASNAGSGTEKPDAINPESGSDGAGFRSDRSGTAVHPSVPGEVCARIRQRQPARLSAGKGWTWILQGLALFKANFLSWLAMVLVLLLIMGVISVIPVLGTLAALILLQVFLGGLMLAAEEQMQTGVPRIGTLFAGFKQHAGSLFALGSLYLTAVFMMLLLVGILTAAFGYSTLNGLDPAAFQQADPVMMMQMLGPVLPLMLVLFLALMLPLQMAFWFAPALVVLGRLPPTLALQLSLQASWRNVLGFLLFGFTLGVTLNLAMLLPFGLGLIGSVLVMALMITSTYCAFREIFCSEL